MAHRWHIEEGPLLVGRQVVGPLENNSYLVASEQSRRAVIIDAADEPDRILSMAQGFDVLAVVTTHGHHDHIGAAVAVRDALGVPFRIHPADAAMAGIEPDEPLGQGDVMDLDGVTLRAIHTPGHTPGSTCLVAGNLLFSGDTLFPGGPGATRGSATAFHQIMTSLRTRLFTLDDDTIVLPGHGLQTTIGTERPFLDAWEERGW